MKILDMPNFLSFHLSPSTVDVFEGQKTAYELNGSIYVLVFIVGLLCSLGLNSHN